MNIFVKFFKKVWSVISSPASAWRTIFDNERKIREMNQIVEHQTQLISQLAAVQNEMVNVVISRELDASQDLNSFSFQDDSDEFIN